MTQFEEVVDRLFRAGFSYDTMQRPTVGVPWRPEAESFHVVQEARQQFEAVYGAYTPSTPANDTRFRYREDVERLQGFFEQEARQIAAHKIRRMDALLSRIFHRYLFADNLEENLNELVHAIRDWLPFVSNSRFVFLSQAERRSWENNIDIPDEATSSNRNIYWYDSWYNPREGDIGRIACDFAMISNNTQNSDPSLHKVQLYRSHPIILLFPKAVTAARMRNVLKIGDEAARRLQLRRIVSRLSHPFYQARANMSRDFDRADIQWENYTPILIEARERLFPRDYNLRMSMEISLRRRFEQGTQALRNYVNGAIDNLSSPTNAEITEGTYMGISLVLALALVIPTAGASMSIVLSAMALSAAVDTVGLVETHRQLALQNDANERRNVFRRVDAALEVAPPAVVRDAATDTAILAVSYLVPVSASAALAFTRASYAPQARNVIEAALETNAAGNAATGSRELVANRARRELVANRARLVGASAHESFGPIGIQTLSNGIRGEPNETVDRPVASEIIDEEGRGTSDRGVP